MPSFNYSNVFCIRPKILPWQQIDAKAKYKRKTQNH